MMDHNRGTGDTLIDHAISGVKKVCHNRKRMRMGHGKAAGRRRHDVLCRLEDRSMVFVLVPAEMIKFVFIQRELEDQN